jgi:hypothetical protein
VVDHPDGRLTVRSGGVSLAFQMIRPAYLTRCAMAPDDVVDSKRLSAVLALLHERQAMPPATIHVAGG